MINLSVHLEACDPERNIWRSYSIAAGQDLFDHWNVAINYGRIGTKGRTKTFLLAGLERDYDPSGSRRVDPECQRHHGRTGSSLDRPRADDKHQAKHIGGLDAPRSRPRPYPRSGKENSPEIRQSTRPSGFCRPNSSTTGRSVVGGTG